MVTPHSALPIFHVNLTKLDGNKTVDDVEESTLHPVHSTLLCHNISVRELHK